MGDDVEEYSSFLDWYVGLIRFVIMMDWWLMKRLAGWFKGLSSSFLSARTARLLILAGTDRLDKELMIGQMQGESLLPPPYRIYALIHSSKGKFQMEVFSSGVGHNLQEDDPTRLAEVLIEFWRRNERVIKGVKKVGDV